VIEGLFDRLTERRARRRLAYQRTFCGDATMPHANGAAVLADLRKLARIDDGGLVVSPVTRMTDSHATAYRAGLRDMYLRIAAHLGVDESQDFSTEDSTHESESAHS
jgi:hypothetical protein